MNNKFEIEKLVDEMMIGFEQALAATGELFNEYGVEPALRAHMMLMTVLTAMKNQDDEELFDLFTQFLEKKAKEEQQTNSAIEDLIKGIGGINLN